MKPHDLVDRYPTFGGTYSSTFRGHPEDGGSRSAWNVDQLNYTSHNTYIITRIHILFICKNIYLQEDCLSVREQRDYLMYIAVQQYHASHNLPLGTSSSPDPLHCHLLSMPHTHSQAGLKKRMSKAQYKSKLTMRILFTLKKNASVRSHYIG